MQAVNDCDTIMLKKETLFKLITLLLQDKAVSLDKSLDKIWSLASPERDVVTESTGTGPDASSVSSEDPNPDEWVSTPITSECSSERNFSFRDYCDAECKQEIAWCEEEKSAMEIDPEEKVDWMDLD